MSKIKSIETIRVAQCYVTALYYGDLSGLEDNELEPVTKMIEYIGDRTIEVAEKSEGFNSCEISHLIADTVELELIEFERES